MKIGVFCSANNNIDPDFFRLADELATWMGNNGHTLVWGGCNLGLMQQLGKSIKVGELSFEGLTLSTPAEVVVCSVKATRASRSAAAAAAQG